MFFFFGGVAACKEQSQECNSLERMNPFWHTKQISYTITIFLKSYLKISIYCPLFANSLLYRQLQIKAMFSLRWWFPSIIKSTGKWGLKKSVLGYWGTSKESKRVHLNNISPNQAFLRQFNKTAQEVSQKAKVQLGHL